MARPMIEALEPRLLFSAVADVALFDDQHSDPHYLAEAAANLDLSQIYASHADATALNDLPQLPDEQQSAPPQVHQVVFVDTSVTDYQRLVDDIYQNHKDAQIIYLDPTQNGVDQVSQALANYTGLDAVHFISHSQVGALELGNQVVNTNNLDHFSQQISNWKNSLSESADILFYGCDLAANTQGLALMDRLAELTKADIAASDDITGHKNLGGDWLLEQHKGSIESGVIVSAAAQADWQGTLADTNYIYTGSGNRQVPVSSGSQVGQSFNYDSPGATYTVNEISLQLARFNNAVAQTITVELRDSWNGVVLGSASIASSAISATGFEWHTFSFADVSLTDSQTYYIQVTTSANDNAILISHHDANVYNNSSMIQNGTPDALGWDLAFKLSQDDGTNAAPVVANPISDKSVNQDTAFNYVMPANTFSDPDNNDTLSYRAQLQGGGSLDWITFNEITRTFGGTPHNHQVGTWHVEVIATDNHGASTSEFFDVVVNNVNDTPVLDNPIADKSVHVNNPFNYVVPANTFSDPDNDTLSYTAQLSGGGALPSWLHFDGSTRTFSGTPGNGDTGTISVQVIASDPSTATASDTFDISIANVYDDTGNGNSLYPLVPGDFAGQSIQYSSAMTTNEISVQIYKDPGAANQTLTMELRDGYNGNVIALATVNTSSLSAGYQWVSFDFADINVPAYQVNWMRVSSDGTDHLISVAYHNTDVYNTGVFFNNVGGVGNWDMAFAVNQIPANSAPTVANPIPDNSATEMVAFSYTFPANTFNDANGDTLTYTAKQSNGSPLPPWLNFNAATRTFSGMPDDGDVGTRSIQVTASDGRGGIVSDTFDLVIINVNDPPTVNVPVPDQTATKNAAYTYTFPAYTFADQDVGATHTYTATLGSGAALPSWLNFDSNTRTFSGTPGNSDVGTITIKLTADDGQGGSVSDFFDMVVNNSNTAPTVTITPPSYSVTEQVAINLHGTGISFGDIDGDNLTVTLSVNGTNNQLTAAVGTTGVAISSGNGSGSLVLTGTAAQLNNLLAGNNGGSLTYRIAADTPVASHTLTITASDGVLTGSDTATLNITAVNDAPVNTVPVAQTVNEDTALIFSAGNGNQIQIADVDAASSNLQVTLAVGQGNVTLGAVTGLSFSAGDGTADGNMVFTGTLANINAALATITYTPNPDFAGGDTLTITTNDLGNTGSGGALSDTDTVAITVLNVNDVPVVNTPVPDQITSKNSAFSYSFAANTFTDPDASTTLTYTATLGNGAALPAWLIFDANTRTFSGTPGNADVGTITIKLTADDGSGGTVSDLFDIVVNNSSTAPVVTIPPLSYVVTEQQSINLQGTGISFADADGDSLSVTVAVNGSNNQLTAVVGTTGVNISSGNGSGHLIVTGTVAQLNDFFAGNNGGALTYVNSADAPAASLTLTITASDGVLSSSDSAILNIAAVNDAPVNVLPGAQTATEDTPLIFNLANGNQIQIADADAANGNLQVTLSVGQGQLTLGRTAGLSFTTGDGSADASMVFSGTLANINAALANIIYVGSGPFPGSDTLSMTTSDLGNTGTGGALIDSGAVAINLLDINHTPEVSRAIPNQNGTVDQALRFSFSANTFIDQDAGDILSYSAQLSDGTALPGWLHFDSATRSFSGTPVDSDVGQLVIKVTADDGVGGIVSTQFELSILPTGSNNPPTVSNPIANQTATEDSQFIFVVPDNSFSDANGDPLTWTAQLADGSALPAWLGFDATSHSFSGTPGNADTGQLSIRVIVSDASGETASDLFVLNVLDVNKAPVSGNPITAQTAIEDAPFNFQIPANSFTDGDNDPLTYSARLADGKPLPSWLHFDAATRSFSGTPLNSHVGNYAIEVIASDVQGASATQIFALVVSNTNDAPQAIIELPTQSVKLPASVDYQVPVNAFSDEDAQDQLHYSALMANGGNLPAWLHFDSDKMRFYGTPAADDIGSHQIILRATDNAGASADLILQIDVSTFLPDDRENNNGQTGNGASDGKLPDVTTPQEPPRLPDNPGVTPPKEIDRGDIDPAQPTGDSGATTGKPELIATREEPPAPLITADATIKFSDVDATGKHSLIDRMQAQGSLLGGAKAASSSALANLIGPASGFSAEEEEKFNAQLNRFREQMDSVLHEEQQQKALLAGITLSITTGLLIWSLRASSLLLTLMSMLPLWRGIDPLPILDEVNKRKKQLEQERKDKAEEDKTSKEVGYMFDHIDSGRK